MDIKLQQMLMKKYPKIFRQSKLSMKETAMCWGIECGNGWLLLIDELCHRIQTHCDKMKFQVEFSQVKEKFGGLRCYMDGDEYIFQLELWAMRKSYHICEDCGTEDNVKTWYIGWNRTLCVDCAKKCGSYYTPLYYWYFNNIRNRWYRFIWKWQEIKMLKMWRIK